MDNKNLLDVSWESILKVVLVFLLIYFLFSIKDILVFIVFALIISILFNPPIEFLQKKGVPRVLAVSLIYVFIFGLLSYSIYLISLSFVSEIRQFGELFSQYFEKIAPPLKGLGLEAFESFEVFINSLEKWLAGASNNILSALFSIFGGVFAAFTIFFLAFFFSLEEKWTEKLIRLLFPERYEEIALRVWYRSQQKISSWFVVRILCCFFVGILSFVVLKLFKVDYAFSLSLFAGLTNIVPILGPVLAGAVITFLVFFEDWLKAVFILIAFILIQQAENLLTPILIKRFIGLPPVLVFISLIIGGALWGILGAILAIPLAGILFEFIKDFLEKRKQTQS